MKSEGGELNVEGHNRLHTLHKTEFLFDPNYPFSPTGHVIPHRLLGLRHEALLSSLCSTLMAYSYPGLAPGTFRSEKLVKMNERSELSNNLFRSSRINGTPHRAHTTPVATWPPAAFLVSTVLERYSSCRSSPASLSRFVKHPYRC